VLGEVAKALATETPESFNVIMVLGVVSACVAKRFSVSPKPGWLEPINIYTLMGLPLLTIKPSLEGLHLTSD
jgi:hypothetical protein